MSYVERTVFFKNLLGAVQTSSAAITYSKYPKTNVDIFFDILAHSGVTALKSFFYFNFKRAVVYNFFLDVRSSTLRAAMSYERTTLRIISSYYYVSTY